MKHIVSLSGGIGSYFALKRVLEKYPKEDVIAVFCDTLAEDGDLYRFLDDIENKLDIKIKRECLGKTPTELCFEHKFLFNSRVAKCSVELKSKVFRKFLKENNLGSNDTILYFGIDFTEKHRCKAIEKNYAPYKCGFPLCEQPYLFKNEMLEELKNDEIEIPRLYKLGFSHNNCGGFCYKAGIGHYKNLLEKDRNRYLECENKEEMIRQYLGKDVSMMKRKGKPFTLRELRLIVDKQPEQISIFEPLTESECLDIGGCGCFVEESEE